ncbi:hypothetical protein [Haloprofundus marisrubri]|nr:hypothetical protein [Haloprofundus marisrubri]
MPTESESDRGRRIGVAAAGTTVTLVGLTLFWLWREHAPLWRHVQSDESN